MLADILEALTILCFGLSWPVSIHKSWVSRTAKGKSVVFEVILLVGYAIGIVRKVIQVGEGASGFIFWLGFCFYVLNFIQICIDMALYARNVRLDREREVAAALKSEESCL